MKKLIPLLASLIATPALAASGPFVSLSNSNFIVMLAFILFVAILLWAKVPAKIGGLLDGRAAQIKAELEEAKALREEAKAILASYERKSKEMMAQSEQIVAAAKAEAQNAAVHAKEELKTSIARRVAAAEERIASAEAGAIREVRERAVDVAVSAASSLLAKQFAAEGAAASIDDAIEQVAAKLH